MPSTKSYIAKVSQKPTIPEKSPARDKMVAEENDYKARAIRIREARKHAGLSQSQLAAKVGVTTASVGQWESRGQIAGKNLSKAARVMGVSADWILTGQGEMVPGSLTFGHKIVLNPQPDGNHSRNLIPEFRVLWHGTRGTLRKRGAPPSMVQRPVFMTPEDSPNAYAVSVLRASETQGLRDGSTLYIDPDGEPMPGEWAAIWSGDDVIAVEITEWSGAGVKYVHIFTREPGKLDHGDYDRIEALVGITH